MDAGSKLADMVEIEEVMKDFPGCERLHRGGYFGYEGRGRFFTDEFGGLVV